MRLKTFLLLPACFIALIAEAQKRRISAATFDQLPATNYEICIRTGDSLLKAYNASPFVVGEPTGAGVEDGLNKIDYFYQKALTYRPNDPYAIAQSNDIKKRIADDGTGDMDRQYQKIITKADEYFSIRDYANAVKYYERALTFRPNDVYPKGQLYLCQRMQRADELFDKREYVKAREQYKIALKDLPNDPYLKEKIAETDLLIRCATTPVNDEIYRKIVTMADDFFSKKNYPKAKEYYELALKYRSEDSYSQARLVEVMLEMNGE